MMMVTGTLISRRYVCGAAGWEGFLNFHFPFGREIGEAKRQPN
jgi:hypothetical protein